MYGKEKNRRKRKENQNLHLSDRNRSDRTYKPNDMNCEVYFLVLTEQIYVQSMWLGGQKYPVLV